MKFHRLTVIGERSATGHVLCRCDCGKECTVWWWNVKDGKTKSCGCIRGEARVKHGYARRGERSSTYKTWSHIVQRTTNPNCNSFQDYGGRGISIDPNWLTFANFIADMGDKPAPGYELDRKDNDGPYTKANCRWVSREVNANNKRSTRWIEHAGQRHSLAQWGRLTGISTSVIAMRMDRLGWPAHRALSTPTRGQH